MIRIRNIATGQPMELGSDYAVEVLDKQGNPALILIPDGSRGSVDIVSGLEDPVQAQNYARTYGLRLSTVLTPPPLQSIATPP